MAPSGQASSPRGCACLASIFIKPFPSRGVGLASLGGKGAVFVCCFQALPSYEGRELLGWGFLRCIFGLQSPTRGRVLDQRCGRCSLSFLSLLLSAVDPATLQRARCLRRGEEAGGAFHRISVVVYQRRQTGRDEDTDRPVVQVAFLWCTAKLQPGQEEGGGGAVPAKT